VLSLSKVWVFNVFFYFESGEALKQARHSGRSEVEIFLQLKPPDHWEGRELLNSTWEGEHKREKKPTNKLTTVNIYWPLCRRAWRLRLHPVKSRVPTWRDTPPFSSDCRDTGAGACGSHETLCVCVCVWERESVWVRVCACVCVCVWWAATVVEKMKTKVLAEQLRAWRLGSSWTIKPKTALKNQPSHRTMTPTMNTLKHIWLTLKDLIS